MTPEQLVAAVEAAYRVGGLPACEAMREPQSRSRRLVEAATAAVVEGYRVVNVTVQSSLDDSTIVAQTPAKMMRIRYPKSTVWGVAGFALEGTREETVREHVARVGTYGADSPCGRVPIWAAVTWAWCYPNGPDTEFETVLDLIKRRIFQVVDLEEARKAAVHVTTLAGV